MSGGLRYSECLIGVLILNPTIWGSILGVPYFRKPPSGDPCAPRSEVLSLVFSLHRLIVYRLEKVASMCP